MLRLFEILVPTKTPPQFIYSFVFIFLTWEVKIPQKSDLLENATESESRDRGTYGGSAAELPAVRAGSHSAHAAHHLHSSHVYLEKGWALLILQSSFWFGATSLLAAFQHYTSHSDTR